MKENGILRTISVQKKLTLLSGGWKKLDFIHSQESKCELYDAKKLKLSYNFNLEINFLSKPLLRL